MPRLTPESAAQRRRQILEAATVCFSNHGLHATTMQDICRQAGLSPGSVYSWFDGKEAIIEAVAQERHAEEQRIIQEAIGSGEPREALHRFFEMYFAWLADPGEQQRRRVSIQVWAESLVNERMRDSVEAGVAQRGVALDYLRAAQDRGQLPGQLSPDGLTRVLLAIVQGFILQQAWDPGINADDYRQTASAIFDALMGEAAGGDGHSAQRQ